MLGTALRGERHVDGDVLFIVDGGREIHVVNQAQIDDVDGNLGIVATLQRAQNVLLGDSHC